MNKLRLLFMAMLLAVASAYANDLLVRYPAISPDGTKLAFTFQGDIWVSERNGANARRLTIHEAYDGWPVWSSDGKNLAFSSYRTGNRDIFTIPVAGGVSRRLTSLDSHDQVSDWTGKTILFTTDRTYKNVEWDDEIYQVDSAGGTPFRSLDAFGDNPASSPSGNLLAFVKGSCRIDREAYDGPANLEIWIFNRKTGKYQQLTRNTRNDFLPRWAGDRNLYFISARTGVYNLYRQGVDEDGQQAGPAEKLTRFDRYGLTHFDVSADGKYLVMERFGEIYLLAPGMQVPQPIRFNLYTDYRFNPVMHKTISNHLESFTLSPDGKKTAFQHRGELFVKENNKEQSRSVNLSQHAYRDRDLSWLNNESLVFASDRAGQYDLYFTRSADPNKPDLFKSLKRDLVKITQSPEDETDPVVSPDGQKVVFFRGKTKFILARINKTGKLSEEKILIEGWNLPRQVQWSPDSRWLAYSRTDLDFNEEIFIHNIEDGNKPVNISMHPREDKTPRWSPDGSKLGFISNRNNGDEDVWFVWLKQSDWEKTLQDRQEGLYFEPETEEKDSVNTEKKSKPLPLVIDLDNIHHRLQQVTSLPGSETRYAISKDGNTFFYTASNPVILGKSDLFSISFDRRNPRQLTRDGQNPLDLQPDREGKYLYYLKQGGYLQRLELKTSKLENLPVNAEMVIDAPAEKAQLFAEACSQVQQGFYDPGYHGKNFDSLVRDFRPLCLNASTKRDFRDMFNFMLGQLNASHMGLYGSDEGSTANERSGHTGLEVKPGETGVEIVRILPESPADKSLSKLYPGEIILSVNGIKVSPVVNFNSLFLEKADKQVLLEVKDKRGKVREVVIRPVSTLQKQEYDAWVQEKRDLVNLYSNGRLGYIHIAGMDWQSFERFERELTASGYGKEGILIDVRFNGGGWTTDYLMTVLNVKQHAYTIPRNAAENLETQHQDFKAHYPFGERLPYAAWTKPSVALCNSSSYSNAEIFSHAFQSLGLGKLVGEPTFGAVISTGAYRLMDGSLVRMPFRAWYVKNSGKNMEGTPAMPDILVQNPPNVRSNGEDLQLQKAVETLLESIDQNLRNN